MRVHQLLAVALVLPILISCGNSEEAVLQQGRDESGTPTKVRTRLAVQFDGSAVDKECMAALDLSGLNPETDKAEIRQKIKDECNIRSGKAVKGRGALGINWFYYDLSLFYNNFYYQQPFYNNFNYGCNFLFGPRYFNWGQRWRRSNCFDVAGVTQLNPVNTCIEYCATSTSNTYINTCGSCGGFNYAW